MKHNTIIEGGFVSGLSGVDQNQSNWSKARLSGAKRFLDVALALGVVVFLFPLYVLIAVLIKMNDGGPALFKQRRIGVDGKEFYCYKFRTMVLNAEEQLKSVLENDPKAAAEWRQFKKLKKDPRITNIGHFLRKSSLDELPQLLNIIKGEMSVIGPRTITRAETPDYGGMSDFAVYCSVRPGVLGLWQLSGRSDTGFEKRVELDVKYVREWSLWNDIKILFISIPAVLLGKGAY
ncbi:sugar transferase [Hirschia baltica]|uniref:sugar transferase n=1 Tax=Hirschia baltica TaxID=2724 RepID=UPI000A043CA1|nr:sugar transferase [Hirschia baltica]